MPSAGIDDYAGLTRHVDIGVAIAPAREAAAAGAKALAAILDSHDTPTRLAAIGSAGSRMVLTVAVTLGDVDDVKVAGPQSRAALALIRDIVDTLAAYDPALVLLPDPESAEAQAAARVQGSVRQSDGVRASTVDSAAMLLAAAV